MESWDTYWQGPPYWDGYAYGPFAESSGCVSTGSRHVRVANIQSGMMPVMVSSESGSCIQPACSSRSPDSSKNKVGYSVCSLLIYVNYQLARFWYLLFKNVMLVDENSVSTACY